MQQNKHVDFVLTMGKLSTLAGYKLSPARRGAGVGADSNGFRENVWNVAKLRPAPDFGETDLSVDFGVYKKRYA